MIAVEMEGTNKNDKEKVIFNILEGTEWGKQQDGSMISKLGDWSSEFHYWKCLPPSPFTTFYVQYLEQCLAYSDGQ